MNAVTAITKANSSGAPFLAFAGAGGAGTSATGLLGGASLLTFNSFFLAGAYKSVMSCKLTAVWGTQWSRHRTRRKAYFSGGGSKINVPWVG